jgi:hypothetical protein
MMTKGENVGVFCPARFVLPRSMELFNLDRLGRPAAVWSKPFLAHRRALSIPVIPVRPIRDGGPKMLLFELNNPNRGGRNGFAIPVFKAP